MCSWNRHRLCVLKLLVLATLSSVGCNNQPPSSLVVSNTQVDIGHDHRHQHDAQSPHEHEHINFSGAHEHPHQHGHRHGEPLYGGVIHPIGHSHHEEESPNFHAEVLLTEDGKLTVHFLIEDGNEFVPFPLSQEKIDGTVCKCSEGLETTLSMTLESIAGDNDLGTSTFTAQLPASHPANEQLEFDIPELYLGSEKHSLNFQAIGVPE